MHGMKTMATKDATIKTGLSKSQAFNVLACVSALNGKQNNCVLKQLRTVVLSCWYWENKGHESLLFSSRTLQLHTVLTQTYCNYGTNLYAALIVCPSRLRSLVLCCECHSRDKCPFTVTPSLVSLVTETERKLSSLAKLHQQVYFVMFCIYSQAIQIEFTMHSKYFITLV